VCNNLGDKTLTGEANAQKKTEKYQPANSLLSSQHRNRSDGRTQ